MQPGKQLIQEVRVGFIRQGTSLSAYCLENGIEGKTVHRLLSGEWNGKVAKKKRKQLMDAANVSYVENA